MLPVTWTSADTEDNGEGGPRKYGWLRFEYRTKGCQFGPNIAGRMFIRKRVLAGVKRIV